MRLTSGCEVLDGDFWKDEWLSGSTKGKWTRLLIYDLKAWLERGHG